MHAAGDYAFQGIPVKLFLAMLDDFVRELPTWTVADSSASLPFPTTPMFGARDMAFSASNDPDAASLPSPTEPTYSPWSSHASPPGRPAKKRRVRSSSDAFGLVTPFGSLFASPLMVVPSSDVPATVAAYFAELVVHLHVHPEHARVRATSRQCAGYSADKRWSLGTFRHVLRFGMPVMAVARRLLDVRWADGSQDVLLESDFVAEAMDAWIEELEM
ncbi:hypothetical protein GGF31_007321 [Allomyces arbusculus]|nr:hypothetical protein GGF31_007321 [Allomyces arbusculus]